jgi:hypothetical protein
MQHRHSLAIAILLPVIATGCDDTNRIQSARSSPNDASDASLKDVQPDAPSVSDATPHRPDTPSDATTDLSGYVPSPHAALPDPPVSTAIGAKEHRVTSITPESVVDVTHPPYNAPTDGQSDAHSSIQRAINDHAGDGETIYLPPGDYAVSDPIRIHADDTPIALKGAGSRTRIVVEDATAAGIEIGDYNSGNRTTGAVVRDLFVHKTAGPAENANGIQVSSTGTPENHTELRNIWVAGFNGARSEGIRIGANGDSIIHHATVSGSGGHGFALPNYGPGQLSVTSVLAFNNGFHSGNGYGIDADGATIEHAISIGNGQGAKTSPDSNAPETIWRDVWLIENDGIGFQITESVTDGIILDGMYAIDNESWGFRLTDKVQPHFRGDIRASSNGQSGDTGNVLIRAGNLDFERIETCHAAGGPGAWAAGSSGGSIDTYVHTGNADAALTGAAGNLDIDQMIQQPCDIPVLP